MAMQLFTIVFEWQNSSPDK